MNRSCVKNVLIQLLYSRLFMKKICVIFLLVACFVSCANNETENCNMFQVAHIDLQQVN